ncbi:MAG: hypothetical protein KY461_15075 [Actinobacteria bacterium]|nr:hypothetical protein [Actinomycetota bacterium]
MRLADDPRTSPATTAAGRRRLPRRSWPVAVVVLAVAMAVAAVVVSTVTVASAGPVTAIGTEVTSVPEFGERGSLVLLYHDGREVTYTFPLRNDGWLPVTVTDVALTAPEERPLLVPTGLGLDGPDGATAPFLPFRLGPGETRTVVIEGLLDNCEYHTERAVHLVGHHVVHLRAGGVATTRSVALDDEVVVRSPTIRRCPDRVMDRSAFTR